MIIVIVILIIINVVVVIVIIIPNILWCVNTGWAPHIAASAKEVLALFQQIFVQPLHGLFVTFWVNRYGNKKKHRKHVVQEDHLPLWHLSPRLQPFGTHSRADESWSTNPTSSNSKLEFYQILHQRSFPMVWKIGGSTPDEKVGQNWGLPTSPWQLHHCPWLDASPSYTWVRHWWYEIAAAMISDICVMTFTVTKLKLCLHSKVYSIIHVPICPIFQWHEQVIPSSERAQLLCFHGILFHELSL